MAAPNTNGHGHAGTALQTTQPLGANAMVSGQETAATAVAAQARAAVESRYLMALRQPRSWDDVRVKLLGACRRPGFAEVAKYSKPVGGKPIIGASIRFAEEALRCMGNVLIETPVIYDDDEKRIVRATVTDLEGNLSYQQDVTIVKTVERSRQPQGQDVLRTRVNVRGNLVYIVAATDDDLLNKQNALVSKAIRTGALRVLPGDILEECMEQVDETQKKQDAEDPDRARKRLADAFYQLGVMPNELEAYIGRSLNGVTPAQLADLRRIYQAMKEGETTWQQVAEQKAETEKTGTATAAAVAGASAPPAARAKATGTEALKDTLKKGNGSQATDATTSASSADAARSE